MTASLVLRLSPDAVTAGENAAPPSGGKASKTPRQPFAEIATLVNARVDTRADNVVAGKMAENPLATGERPLLPTSAILARTVVANPLTTETRKTTPRGPTGETPAIETLIQVGCQAAVCPTPAQPVQGPSSKVVIRPPATVQADAGPTLPQRTVLPVDPEKPALSNGASVSTGKPASLAPQMVESKVLQAQTPAMDPQFRTEQTRQVNLPAIQAQSEQPLVESLHVSSRGSGKVRPEGRQAAAGLGNPKQTRQAAEASVSPAGAKAANPSQADGNATGQPPLVVLESGKSVGAPEYRSADGPMTAGAFEGAAARSPTASVGEQILDSVHASLTRGEQQLVVRLRPPELGSVLVRFSQDDDGVHGVLEVGRNDTRRQIEQALPQMLRNLQELGIQVRRLDVTVAEQPENDLGKGQSQQETWTEQQGSDQHADQPQRSFDTGWAAGPNDGDAIDLHEAAQVPTDLPADRIDMLA